MKLFALTAAAAALLLMSAPAEARPPLSQARADAAAEVEMAGMYAHFAQTYSADLPVGWVRTETDDGSWSATWNVLVVRDELDPCDVDRRGAECDGTVWMSDGDVCDVWFAVELTRRGRLRHWTEDMVCDSEAVD